MELQAKIVNRRLKNYKEIKDLLQSAFPECERIPMWRLCILSKARNVNFRAFYTKSEFCGFAYTIESDTMIYILYLAVNDKIRSKGYGTKILSWIKKQNSNKEVVLHVEMPNVKAENNLQRIKRIAFYEKNGFTVSNWLLSTGGEDYNILSSFITS